MKSFRTKYSLIYETLHSSRTKRNIEAKGAMWTGEVTGTLSCDVENIEGIQFFYNLDEIILTSSNDMELGFLTYLDQASVIDISGTAVNCNKQIDLRDSMPGTQVLISPSC